VTIDFAVPFRVISDGDLGVYISNGPGTLTLLTQGVHYALLNVNDPSGSTVRFSTPPPAGHRIDIIGAAPYTQPLTLYNQGPYFAEDVMNGMDRIVVLIQQLVEQLSRAVVLPVHLADFDIQQLIDLIVRLGPQLDNIILIAERMPEIIQLLDQLPTLLQLLDLDIEGLVAHINTLLERADQMENLLSRITLSTEPPSGGQAGDLWFRVYEL
jgi:hypothetical protein